MRKDLKDLRKLPRSAFVSYQKKHAQPHRPRSRAEAAQRLAYPALSAFAPHRVWRWVTEYWRFRIGRRHPFQTYDGEDGDNGVYELRGDAPEIRIALAGDWGTGTDEAAEVAALIEAWRPHYSIHLGDVYYVGDPAEVGANFLGIPNPRYQFAPCKWPLGSEGAFALNGNHEMYALGYGYFDHILPKLGVSGSPRGQRASYFCLENDHWRIIALDTSYNSVGAPILEHFLRARLRAACRTRRMAADGGQAALRRSARDRDLEPPSICLALRSLLPEAGATIGGVFLPSGPLALGARAPAGDL